MKREQILILVLLVLFPLLVGSPTLFAGFAYDDGHSIVENPHLRDPGLLFRYFVDASCFSANPENAMYRPVLLLSYMVNYTLGGMNPWSWHLCNLLMHLLCIQLLFRLLLLLFPQRFGIVLFVSTLFAVHPFQVEVLGHVSSRSDLLMGLLLCGSLFLMVKAVKSCGLFSWQFLIPAWALHGAAMLTKEPALLLPMAALPLLLFACPGADLFSRARRVLVVLGPSAILSVGYLLLRRSLLGQVAVTVPAWSGGSEPLTGHGRDMVTHLSTQAVALIKGLGLFVFPMNLSADHQFTFQSDPFNLVTLTSIAGLVIVLVGAFALACHRKYALSGIWWLLVILSPVILIPLNQIFAEHRFYGPGLGMAIFLVAFIPLRWPALDRRALPSWLPVTIAGTLLLFMGGRSLCRGFVWRSAGTLWEATLATDPGSFRGWSQLGQFQGGRGEYALAMDSFRRAHELHFGDPAIAVNRIEYTLRVAEETKDSSLAHEAERVAKETVSRFPWKVDARIKWVRSLLILNNLESNPQFAKEAQEVCASLSSYAAPHGTLFSAWATALEASGETEGAIALWRWSDRMVSYGSRTLGPRLGQLIRFGKKEEAYRLLGAALKKEGPTAHPQALAIHSRLKKELTGGNSQREPRRSPRSVPRDH